MKKFVTYLRVSTTKQGASGLGLEAQRKMCAEFIARNDGECVSEFIDVESGTHRDRKGLWQAIDYCKRNGTELVIAKLDRLARDVEFTFRVMNSGIQIHFTDMPVVNTMILGVFAAVAQYERELCSSRTKASLSQKKAHGAKLGASNDKYRLTRAARDVEEVKAENLKNLKELQDFVEGFNTKYGERINKYFKTTSKKYDITFIYDLCDAYVSDYTDRRDLSDFQNSGIDLEEFQEFCMEYMRMHFLYYFFGDEEKVLARLDSSKLMTEYIHYMKQRVDADINGINLDEKYNDYSRPKMLLISGHDSTSSSDEAFMLYALGYNLTEKYKFPKFANQIALEVVKENDGTPKKSYSDYKVNCYFNDDLLFNVTLDEFIKKIEAKVWSDEKIS